MLKRFATSLASSSSSSSSCHFCVPEQGGSRHDEGHDAVGYVVCCDQSPSVQGTVIVRQKQAQVVKERPDGTPVKRQVSVVALQHTDIISDSFWDMHPDVLR